MATMRMIHQREAGWGRLALMAGALAWGGCANVVTTPGSPDGSQQQSDGPPTSPDGATEPIFFATMVNQVLGPTSEKLLAEQWHEWKRDPTLVLYSGYQYLFFAGSPSTAHGAEKWTLGWASIPVGMAWSSGPAFQQVAKPSGGNTWNGQDLMAPAVLPPQGGSSSWTLLYAGRAPGTPDYVTQIGAMTSTDPTLAHWNPAQAAPLFSVSMTSGPDGYGATDPELVQIGAQQWLYYAGLSCTGGPCQYQILRRTLEPASLTVGPAQVVLTGDGSAEEAGGVAGPSLIMYQGRYHMAYTALKSRPQQSWATLEATVASSSIQMAVSSDNGKSFTRVSGASGLAPVMGTINLDGSAGPSLYLDSGAHLQMYFGGYSSSPTSYAIGDSVIGSH